MGARAFAGTARFELRNLLGTGGMGVVFAAYDREHRCEVALKVLPTLGPVAADRIKREFRVASGTHHPNLVSLGELIEENGNLFFTMELVVGVDWLSYVRGLNSSARPEVHPTSGAHSQSQTASMLTIDPRDSVAYGRIGAVDRCVRVDHARLRSALHQLAQGLVCLHQHGKVHRDVKPSNVLVTEEGRVVLLDFGLAVDLSRRRPRDAQRAGGTVLYMSPEQAWGTAPTPASDWYSVGVLLYEALAGRVPFTGTRSQILEAKRVSDPVPPASLGSDVPPDMNDLCLALLERRPEARPSGGDVLALVSRSPTAGAPDVGRSVEMSGFVGRNYEVESMMRAFDDAAWEPLVFMVEGESGIGKTALIGEFCRRLEASDRSALVCCGGCSERESVPFKALDGIAESLAEQLPALFDGDGQDSRGAVAAAQAAALAFPVLNRGAETTAVPRTSERDAWLQQRVAFQGVRDLLSIVARRRRVVLCIDDWQWVDADSIRMLSHVLGAPAPPLLLLLTTRPGSRPPPLPCAHRRAVIDNLEPESAERLAARLLEGVHDGSTSLARAIASESLGHPLFIAALARQAVAGDERKTRRPDLDAAIGSRLEALPSVARTAAELLAVFGAPMTRAVLQSALSYQHGTLSWQDLASSIAQLTLENIARANGVRASDAIDCFHARVAASVLARLTDGRRRERHRALAVALEEHESSDFESMTDHWAEAGDPERAAGYALRAAEGAEGLLAFEQAGRFYRRSLELWPQQGIRALVQRRLAEALGHVGRGREAADAFLAAAGDASGELRIELHRLAADQLFRSGYMDDAVRLIAQVFPSHGLLFPKFAGQTLLWLVMRRLAIRLRGIGFAWRPADSIAPSELARIDAAWTVAVGLSTVDNLKGACVQSGNLLLALRLGEPFRVVRALAAEAAYVGTVGARSKPRVDALLARATALAGELDDPYALGFVHLARCFALYLRSEFEAARAAGDDAEAVFERRPVMASWELTSARMLSISSQFYQGDLRAIRRRVPELVQEADGRGDIYAATCLRLGVCNSAWLVDDDSAEARRQLRVANERWHYDGVHLQECWSLLAWVQVDLYDGDAEQAHARVQRSWRAIERSFVMRFERLRAELFWLRARAALAHAEGDPVHRNSLLAQAERGAARLLRESAPWAGAAGHLVLAGAHAVRGERATALDHLRGAVSLAETCGMHILAGVHQHCAGDGGPAHVRRPDRWIRMIMPGLSRLEPPAARLGDVDEATSA